MSRQRRLSPGLEVDVVRQQHRQVGVGHRDLAAYLAMDDGDRRAPVALTAEEPVAQPERHRRLAPVLVGQPRSHLRDRVGRAFTVEGSGVDHGALARVGVGHGVAIEGLDAVGLDHHSDRQAVLAREREVALVVTGHGHDRARSILHQNVGRHIARHPLAVHRVHRVNAERHALLGVGLLAVGKRRGANLVDQRPNLLPGAAQLCQLLHQRVLHCEHEEGDAPERVRSGGEDPDLVAGLLDLERDVCTLAAADPVPLHGQDALGPLDQRVDVVQQPLRVVGDLVEPLRQIAALDRRPAAFTRTLDHLLVRQDRLVLRAPVDGSVLPVRQAALEEPQEQPLGPPVVLGVARPQHPGPVERHPHPLERRRLLIDVGVGPFLGMDLTFDRRVLSVQTERVPPDRVHDVVALQRAETSHGVPATERLRMAHVQVAGGVGEHVERVEARARVVRIVGGSVEALLLPHPLPLRLDLGSVVPAHGPCMVTNATARSARAGAWPRGSLTLARRDARSGISPQVVGVPSAAWTVARKRSSVMICPRCCLEEASIWRRDT